MRKIFCLIVIVLISVSAQCQTKPVNVWDKLNYYNYLEVDISKGVERGNTSEVSMFYLWGNSIKCHSVVRSNYKKDNIDTCFILSDSQWNILNDFYWNMLNNSFSKDSIKYADAYIIAGSYCQATLAIDTLVYRVNDKAQISLIKKLIK